jgi:hypothetical protein
MESEVKTKKKSTGVMKAIMANKRKISKAIYGLSYEDTVRYMENLKSKAEKKDKDRVLVPGTMKIIMANKKKISKEIYGLSYEEMKKYFERSKNEALARKGIKV